MSFSPSPAAQLDTFTTLTSIVTTTSVATNDSRQPLRKRSTLTLNRAEQGASAHRRPTASGTSTHSHLDSAAPEKGPQAWRTVLTALKKVDVKKLLTPTKQLGPAPSIAKSIRTVVFYSWFNVLLLCIPIAFALHFATPHQYAAIFSTCFIGIIPLAHLLSFATEEVSLRVGQALAGLINATLGNVVELIVAVIALTHCELDLVQSSLIGSILGNLLLVLGMCFFLGGLRFSEQGFAIGAAQLNSSLLTLSVVAVMLPIMYQLSAGFNGADKTKTQTQLLQFSHGIALILLVVYIGYLLFQLVSHKEVYADDSADIPLSTPWVRDRVSPILEMQVLPPTPPTSSNGLPPMLTEEPEEVGAARNHHNDTNTEIGVSDSDSDRPTPELHGAVCLCLLVVVTILVAFTAEYLVSSINGLTASGKLSKAFVGIILLPIAGNIAEHVSAVTSSVKDKLTLSMSIAVGSSIQIALFVIPFIVVVGWGLDKPMSFLFDPLQAICLLLTVLTVNYVVADGKSNWVEGMILLALYSIIGTLFFFYPGSPAQVCN
ncbi:Calcium/proton exchanger [Mycena amicta]|nr:Calcium/proton exchanger [Mycena amicta]